MTGAPVPPGCDAVVMHERTRLEGESVWMEEPEVRAGQNILPRGREMRAGEVVLTAGTILKPAHLGVLASVGRTPVRVVRPRVAVVSDRRRTGRAGSDARPGTDPQFEYHHAPCPGDRGGSGGRVAADRAGRAGRTAANPGSRARRRCADDHRRRLGRPARPGSRGSGGSGCPAGLPQGPSQAGQTALVRDRLAAGRPGRARWSSGCRAIRSAAWSASCSSSGRLWPSWPGARSGLRRRSRPAWRRAFRHRGDRPTYHPARLKAGSEVGSSGSSLIEIETLAWAGSADLRTAAAADGFAAFPAGDRDYQRGEIVGFLPAR